MTWRDIVVHLKAHEDWSEHIEVAIRLAKTFNARLTGLRTSREAATIKQYLGASSAAALEVESGRWRLPRRRSSVSGKP